MTFQPIRTLIAAGLALGAAGAFAGPAAAQSADWSGKTIDMIIGYAPGGGNDAYARAVARHIGNFLPGKPEVVPQNMPGGGSLVAANYIANVAAKDGTALGLVASTIPLDNLLDPTNMKFKATDFAWIGRIALNTNVTFDNADSSVKTIQDAMKEKVTLAATGASSVLSIYPKVLNNMFGTKFDLIMGYKGSAESMLAMERGEVDGHTTSTAALMTAHPEWMTNGKVNFLVQYGLERNPMLPDTPTAVELAQNPDDKKVMTLAMSGADVGKAILAPPGMPDETVAALRKAFDEMVASDEFKQDLDKQRLELSPLSGEKLQALVADLGDAKPELLDKVREIWPN